jgi:hypothetical protein
MKNAEELRKNLSLVFEQLQAGLIEAKVAAELANLGGKMINSAKVQLEYAALRKEKPTIKWLENSDD